jgi:hypothetical protein
LTPHMSTTTRILRAGFARAESMLQGFLIDFASECWGCWFNQAG